MSFPETGRLAGDYPNRVLPILRSASAKQDGGWGGIRTPGAFRHTRFPGVHNRPLCHPSERIFLLLSILILVRLETIGTE